jgi:hypothetical protein
MTGRCWHKVVAMVMVMMIDQGCCRSVMMMMVVHRSRHVVPAVVVQALFRHQCVLVVTVVVRIRSVCQQVTAQQCRHPCLMVMVMMMVMVVMRPRSISIVVVVKARRVMVVAIVRRG